VGAAEAGEAETGPTEEAAAGGPERGAGADCGCASSGRGGGCGVP
jgi:hypothetical protein